MSWLIGFSYRKSITLSRASGAVTNYQMKLLVGESAGASGEDVDCNSHVQTDFDDLRFTTSDGQTLLDYWIESITGTTPNQLATVWIEFDSIGTDATTFYMYYGKASVASASSHINTMIKADDGVTGSLTEATSGGGTLAHSGGNYVFNCPVNADAAIAGCILSDWNFACHIDSFGTMEASANSVNAVGLANVPALADLIGNAALIITLRNFFIQRYDDDHTLYPSYFIIFYYDASNVGYYWTGSAWTTTPTQLNLSSGIVKLKIWSDGTNFYADILNTSGVSLLTSVASIAISGVRGFSSGKCFYWGESRTDAYDGSQPVDNFFVKQYRDPEPAWGSWGSEEEEASSQLAGWKGYKNLGPWSFNSQSNKLEYLNNRGYWYRDGS